MKRSIMIAVVFLGSAVAFGQTQPVTKEQTKSSEVLKISVIADTTLVDKKAIVDDSKKKKPKKERAHKECSRMKS